MKRILPLAAAALLAGCRAHMLETHGDAVKLFDIGQPKAEKGGFIRYLSTGPKSFRTARRADAEKQMRRFCGGEFAVLEEGPRSKFGARAPIPAAALEMDEYWYVAFGCR
ncbi:MAG: hypothetical protein M0D55_03595 [Elusimicrobiota bacterium]|nr:MAG: hypothetical protein M0D55_03595 [Elusimicrobiota bacterium]